MVSLEKFNHFIDKFSKTLYSIVIINYTIFLNLVIDILISNYLLLIKTIVIEPPRYYVNYTKHVAEILRFRVFFDL